MKLLVMLLKIPSNEIIWGQTLKNHFSLHSFDKKHTQNIVTQTSGTFSSLSNMAMQITVYSSWNCKQNFRRNHYNKWQQTGSWSSQYQKRRWKFRRQKFSRHKIRRGKVRREKFCRISKSRNFVVGSLSVPVGGDSWGASFLFCYSGKMLINL